VRLAPLLFGAGLACSSEERPGPLADPPPQNELRFVAGRFGAPESDAGATAGAGGDAGATGVDASAGPSSAGAAGAPPGSSSEPVPQRQIYEAICDPSLVVQWGFVVYEATTPGDSFIELRVRSAPSEPELDAAAFIELIQISTALGTTRCAVTGPAPDCPIDLFVRLGGAPLAHLPFMEVEAVLHPASGDGRLLPGVDAWRMDYSCTAGL